VVGIPSAFIASLTKYSRRTGPSAARPSPLRENGVESSISLKRLLGLADREMKRLFEWGEARYAQSPPVELLNNLLYYVARATSGGPRVAAVRASFRLAELLPVDESIEQLVKEHGVGVHHGLDDGELTSGRALDEVARDRERCAGEANEWRVETL